MKFPKLPQPCIDTVLKIIATLVILALVCWIIFCVKLWGSLHQERAELRRSIAAMTPVEQERLSYDLMAAMFNAAQTNWTMTVTITPRTNILEKP